MTELDYQEMIALSEDPDVSFDEVRGQPFTSEQYAELAEFADSVFYQCTLDVQVRSVIGMSVDISVRRLSRMSDDQRNEILSQVPADLADEIVVLRDMELGVAFHAQRAESKYQRLFRTE